MDKQVTTDIHAHLTNFQTTPPEITMDRWTFSTDILEGIADIMNGSLALDAIETLIEKIFVDHRIDAEEFLRMYFLHWIPYAAQFKLQMTAAGIERAALLGIDFYSWGEKTLNQNEKQAAAQRQIANDDPSFISFCGVDPARPALWEYLGNVAIHHTGIKIYPAMIKDFWLLPQTSWLLRWCERNKKPVIMHSTKGGIGKYENNNNPTLAYSHLLENRDLKICFAHMGGGAYSEEVKSMLLRFNGDDDEDGVAYTDTSFCDDAVLDPANFFHNFQDQWLDYHGAQILFGTDYPLHTVVYDYATAVNAFRDNVDEDTWKAIAGSNIAEFLGE